MEEFGGMGHVTTVNKTTFVVLGTYNKKAT